MLEPQFYIRLIATKFELLKVYTYRKGFHFLMGMAYNEFSKKIGQKINDELHMLPREELSNGEL